MEAVVSGGFVGKCKVFVINKLQEKGWALGKSQRWQKKMLSFLSSIVEKWLEEWILGYQQVIHNTKLPTAAIVQAAATPTYDTKETLGLYKCL